MVRSRAAAPPAEEARGAGRFETARPTARISSHDIVGCNGAIVSCGRRGGDDEPGGAHKDRLQQEDNGDGGVNDRQAVAASP